MGRAFFAELRRLGYVEGDNLIIERYSAEGHHDRYADLAREIVTSNPDLIVTGTNPVVIVFRAATSTIPVIAFMLDVVRNLQAAHVATDAAAAVAQPAGRAAWPWMPIANVDDEGLTEIVVVEARNLLAVDDRRGRRATGE